MLLETNCFHDIAIPSTEVVCELGDTSHVMVHNHIPAAHKYGFCDSADWIYLVLPSDG